MSTQSSNRYRRHGVPQVDRRTPCQRAWESEQGVNTITASGELLNRDGTYVWVKDES